MNTNRTIIKPLSKEDIPAVLEMYQEPDSFKYIAPHKNKTEEYYQTFLAQKIEDNKQGLGFWTVFHKENNDLIGTINLNQFMETSIIHIGCHLSEKYWNKGYAFELMTTLIDYGFTERKLNEIYAVIEVEHTVSVKLFEKLNFELKERITIDGSDLNFYRKQIFC